MTSIRFAARRPALALLAAGVLCSLSCVPAAAADGKPATKSPSAKPKAAARHTAAKKAPPAKGPVEMVPFAATPEQMQAADRVYYGAYDCEFKQTIDIVANPKYAGYVDVKHGKAAYLMKPVLSSTGAIRLEDIRGETLMVQIASKSMLLNVKTAQRLVDDCISPKQRELVEAAKQAKIAEAAAAAASAAAPATPTTAPAEAASQAK
ncbi:hypothetical protein BH11PSE8_BH11PSE8_11570 [soil metagenome]